LQHNFSYCQLRVMKDSYYMATCYNQPASGLNITKYEIYRDSAKIADITDPDAVFYKDSPANPAGKQYIYKLKCIGTDASSWPELRTIVAFGTGRAAQLYSLKSTYSLGEKLNFVFTDGPGRENDWIAIVPRGRPVNASSIIGLPLVYNDSEMSYYAPGSGSGPNHRNLIIKRTPAGDFDAYLMRGDGYNMVAGPVEFSVVAEAQN